MPILVRQAQAADAPTITDFNCRMALETESLVLDFATCAAGVRAALVDANKATYFVAEIDGAIAGQLMITHEWSDWRDGDIWWIQSVYVHQGHRRGGVFKALYQHVQAVAKAAKAAGLRLYVERENFNAQATYQRLGMKLTHYAVMEELL